MIVFASAAVALMDPAIAPNQMTEEYALQVRGRVLIDCVRAAATKADDGKAKPDEVVRAAFTPCSKERTDLRELAYLIEKVSHKQSEAAAADWADKFQRQFEQSLVEDAVRVVMENRTKSRAAN